MKSYQEIMIEKYAEELAEALHTDLNKACKILTKIFKGVRIWDVQELFEKLNESRGDYLLVNDCFGYADRLLLKGTRPGKKDAYEHFADIMETLHYDNGLPLTGYNYPKENPTEWNNYFDHYDRDQDFWEFYCDELIYNFCTDGKNIFMRVDFSLSDLRNSLTYAYDGASWEHDFVRM